MLEQSAEKVFASIMGAYQISARITDNVTYCGEWIEREPQMDRGIFHLISAGSCRVEARYLPEPLDPHFRRSHRVSARQRPYAVPGDTHCRGYAGGYRDAVRRIHLAGRQAQCGAGLAAGFLRGARAGRDRKLPRPRPDDGGAVEQSLFGNQLVLNKLADSLLVLAIRSHVVTRPAAAGTAAGAQRSAAVARAGGDARGRGPQLEHRRTGRVALLSRTAFCEHFSGVLGVAPMQYLTEWRMAEALRLLRDPNQSVARIAERLGYQTEAAFRRAFKRVQGFAPGKVRQEA